MATAIIDRAEGRVEMTVPVEPVPTPRPRVSKWGAYMPAPYKAYVKRLVDAIPPAPVTLLGQLNVEVLCVCKALKASKFTTPLGDLDNIAKGLLDTLTDLAYYGDDRQIVTLWVHKRFPRDGESPHFHVRILEGTP